MKELFEQISIWAAVDIALIAFVIYHLLVLIRGTRAAQMFSGILIILGSLLILSQLYPLTTIKWMMNEFSSSFIIIIVVIFQEDIRLMLSRMGKRPFLSASDVLFSKQMLDEVTRAASSLAARRIGAIIVVERNIILNRYVDIGIPLDARVTKELLLSIFHPTSPIHDGAVIVQEGRCAAAGCFLPLTRDQNIDTNMGTRHRAGIGMSQETDALVILVSEEEGSISLIVDGQVSRGLDAKELRKALRNLLNRNPDIVKAEDQQASFGNWKMIDRMKIFGNKK